MNRESIEITWHINDVHSLEEGMSNDEAFEVLCRAKQYHNAEIGINWDVIQYYIDEVVGERGIGDE
jgi:hypothetical protein